MSQNGMDDFSNFPADSWFLGFEASPRAQPDGNTNLPFYPNWMPEPRGLGTEESGAFPPGEYELGPDQTINDISDAPIDILFDDEPLHFGDGTLAGGDFPVGDSLGAALDPNDLLPLLDSHVEEADHGMSPAHIQASDNNAPAQRKRRPRAQCPSADEWRSHKKTIQRIYLDEDKTLEQTREILRKTHGFDASKQMFKEKFQLWRWHKNLSHKFSGKLTQLATERAPKRTEFRLGQKAWPAEEVIKRAERGGRGEQPAPSHSPELPSNLIIRTPSVCSTVSHEAAPESQRLVSRSPSIIYRSAPMSSPHMQEAFVIRSPDLGNSASSFSRGGRQALMQPYPRPDRSMPPPTLPSIGTLRHFMTPLYPSRLRIDSQTWQSSPEMFKMDLIRAFEIRDKGEKDEADVKIQKAVSGFMNQKDQFDETMIKEAYEMVEKLFEGKEAQQAMTLLDWVSEKCRELDGARDKKTLAHYLKVIRFLRSWSRDQDVNKFIHRIMDSWEHKPDHSATATLTDAPAPAELCEIITKEDIGILFIAPKAVDDAEAQLRLAENLLFTNGTKQSALKKPMQRILDFCEEHSSKDISIFLRATCCLAKVYLDQRRLKRAAAVTLNGQKKVEEYVQQDGLPGIMILPTCTRLAFLLYQSQQQEECDNLLEMVVEMLENDLNRIRIFDATIAIDFFIFVGRQWLQKSCWDAAVPWLERALAASFHELGDDSLTTRYLERVLADQEMNQELPVRKTIFDVL